MQTFLVEHYRPGLDLEALQHAASLVRRAAEAMEDEGRSVRCVRLAIVPADEGFLSLIEASSEDAVRDAFARAGVPFERIAVALLDGGGA